MTPSEFGLLVKSAENGNTDALYRLGLMHLKGKKFISISIPKDRGKSLRYFEAAADGGHALAAWRIGAHDGVPYLKIIKFSATNLTQVITHKLLTGLESLSWLTKFLLKATAWIIGIAIVIGAGSLIWVGLDMLPFGIAIFISGFMAAFFIMMAIKS